MKNIKSKSWHYDNILLTYALIKVDGVDRVEIKQSYIQIYTFLKFAVWLFTFSVISAYLDVELNAKWKFPSSCKSSLNNGNNCKKFRTVFLK